ncbi:MAG: hypothetical protein Q8P30_01450 [Candidatus Uhrbacteria bacterium]|nr:hypothetical protein [Candidatus Uhrbacteria bacterium]
MPTRHKLGRKKSRAVAAKKEVDAARRRRKQKAVRLSKTASK